MEQMLLLVKCITLAYHESEIEGLNSSSSPLIKKIIESIRLPEASLEYDRTRDILLGLIQTAKWLTEQPVGQAIAKDALIQRISVIVGQEVHLLSSIQNTIEKEFNPDERRKERLTIISELSNYQSQQAAKELLREYNKKLLYSNDDSTFAQDWEDFKNKMATVEAGSSAGSVIDSLDIVDINDTEATKACWEKGMMLTSTEGIMQLGQRGLNEMFGEENGLRRGNMYCIGAMSHNGKSLSLKTWPLQVMRYNKPMLVDPSKKPLVLYLSFEDNNEKTYQEMYKYLYENKHQVAISAKAMMESGELTVDDAVQFIKEECQATGYYFQIIKAVGNAFSFIDLYNVIDYYEGLGYEICLLSIDYLDMMSRRHCSGDRDEQKTTSLFRNVRQYCESKMITTLTAHQLSDQANALARDGEENLARSVAERGMWKNCRTLHTEIDVEIVQHIVRPGDGFSYMTYMRGKHRGIISPTPEEKKFVVYRFNPFGGLGEDINGASQARRSVGGGTDGDGGGKAFWE